MGISGNKYDHPRELKGASKLNPKTPKPAAIPDDGLTDKYPICHRKKLPIRARSLLHKKLLNKSVFL